LLCGADELAVVVLGQSLRGEWTAGDAKQQEAANGAGMPQREEDRGSRTGRRPADEDGQGVEAREQLGQVVRPDRFLDLVALDENVRSSGVAPVVQWPAVASFFASGTNSWWPRRPPVTSATQGPRSPMTW
jgi:hypothetical protein